MKRNFLLTCFALIIAIGLNAQTSGTCGTNLTWSFNQSTGKLTISGTGDMYNYYHYNDNDEYVSSAPWIYYKNEIVTVEIGPNVNKIGLFAFRGCDALQNIIIADGSSALKVAWRIDICSTCDDYWWVNTFTSSVIESLYVGRNLMSISEYEYGTSVSSDEISQISSNLTTLTIGQYVTNISAIISSLSTSSLPTISIDANNTNFSVQNNVLYNADKTTLKILFPNFSGELDIPSTVTTIESSAGYRCKNLTSVTIPASVSSIGSAAFSESGVTDVTINNSRVADFQFQGCINLTTITLSQNVTRIGDYAFGPLWGDDEDTSLPISQITCMATTPPTVSSSAFYEVNKRTITLTVPKSSLSAYQAHSEWKQMGTITYPVFASGICGENLRWYQENKVGPLVVEGTGAMYDSPFPNQQGGTSSTISGQVTNILGIVTEIILPEGLTYIGNQAFNSYFNPSQSFKQLVIPSTVTRIGTQAINCNSGIELVLQSATPPTITPTSLRYGSGNNYTIEVSVADEHAAAYLADPNWSKHVIKTPSMYYCTEQERPWTLNRATGEFTFTGSGDMADVPFYIYNQGKLSSNNYRDQVKSIVFSEGITSIGACQIADCDNCTSISFPSTLTSLKTQPICYTYPIKSIYTHSMIPPTAIGDFYNYLFSYALDIYVPCGAVGAYQAADGWSHHPNNRYFTIDDCSYTRSTTPGRYGTICLPKAVAHEDIQGGVIYNIQYAIVNSRNEVTGILMVEEMGDLEAGKPYIFNATADELVLHYTGYAVAEPVATNGLVGNLSEIPLDVPQGMYVLSNNQIRKLAGGTATAGQNRAYIDLTNVTKLNYVPAAAPNRVMLDVEGSNPIATDLLNIKSEYIQKVIRDGQVLILRDGKTYNVLGKTL